LWADTARGFNAAAAAFYGPYLDTARRIRRGDRDAMDAAMQFLAADPWCFRSGYLKADLMNAFANTEVPLDLVERLQDVVLLRIHHPQPRLLRYAARLASNVWTAAFEERLERDAAGPNSAIRARAQEVLIAARHRKRSLDGQRHKRKLPMPPDRNA
jgi:hypothetical protein